jgi:hypothetical protein
MRPGLCFDDAAFSFPLFSGAGVCVIVCSRLHARAAYQVPLAVSARSQITYCHLKHLGLLQMITLRDFSVRLSRAR